MITEQKVKSFPNQFAPPSEKSSQKYAKQYAEAFSNEAAHLPTESALVRGNKNYKRFRSYARGEQSTLQYKELMGLKGANGQPLNTSYRNINFEILKVAPKIRNVVVNKMVNQRFRMRCRPIDSKSISERRKYKSKLLEFIINKEQIERFERLSKLGLERPVPAGEIPPANATEIDPYIDMNPKDITAMEVLDFLTLAFAENDWNQQGREIAGDIFDLGIGGTRQYIDVNNKIRFRKINPERTITNLCIYPDFRDLIRFGEYIEMTVSELKRATRNKWGEDAYKEIANKYAGDGANKYMGNSTAYYDANTYTYAYDHEKVTVLDCMWYSTDTEVYVEYQNESGNRRIKKENFDYVPYRGDKNVNNGKGMSDEEYNEFNKGKKQIHRREVRNVYQCSWVVGSEYVYNEGLLPNMLRSSSNPQETVMPVVLVSTDFMSTMGIIEQPLDQVQLNYLQYQSHVSASKPPGIAIEKRALARVGKGGQGGKKWDPREDLIMYAETGNFVYDGYDEHDQPLVQKPFESLTNGLSEGAGAHFALILQWIDLIRNMLGLNVMTEGQTPPERLGKSVAELSFGASDNALSHLVDAYKSVYERTARNLFYLLQNNVQRMNPEQISESLGNESYKYFMLNRDLGLLDMGIILEEGPDDKIRERISQILQLMVENNQIPGEDAIMIEMVENPYRQILLIRKHRKEREAAEAAKQENLVRAQGEEQTNLAVATEEEKRKTADMEFQQKMEEKRIDAQNKEEESEREFLREMMLKKMEAGFQGEEQEKERLNSLLEKMVQGQIDIKLEREKQKGKPKPATSKA